MKYYPEKNKFSEISFFCNNANAAIDRTTWQKLRFDEEIPGLEDMELAKRFSMDGKNIDYINDAIVFHYHHENWSQIKRRFEREAIALQRIMIKFIMHRFQPYIRIQYKMFKRNN